MISAKSLPMDAVIHILSYCKNVVIKNGNIILIDKLDKNKYAGVTKLLMEKQPPKHYCFPGSIYFYSISSVNLSKQILIYYVCTYNIITSMNTVWYNYIKNNITTHQMEV
jgi:hypothetical protein